MASLLLLFGKRTIAVAMAMYILIDGLPYGTLKINVFGIRINTLENSLNEFGISFFKIKSASLIDAALKNTHVICTNNSVMHQEKILGIFILVNFHNLHITTAMPCKAPHTINDHPAPCHNPPRINVTRTLMAI